MPAVSVQCPRCAQSYSIDGSLVGRRARCKACGQPFDLTPSGEIAGPGPDSSGDPHSGPPPSSWSSTTPSPEKIARFIIKERLGSGAFGTVYRATDPLLGREVALKVPQPGLLQNPKALERFFREARAVAQLRHPHIVTLFETGLDPGANYIATEFIDGTTLAASIGEVGLDPRLAAEIVAALAEALQYAHAQGIVHRDVKPANVMLDKAGQPHLMDFGLARIEGATGERLTQVGAIVGTPAYLAPEQAADGGAEADAASDQYSLGVTLYELLTGKTPFSGPPEVVVYNLTHREIPPPRSLRREIPRDLETICLKAMAKAPAERYGDCRELAEDLGRWLRGEPILARRPGNIGTIRRWVGRHRLVAGLAASALAGFVALGARMAMSPAERTRAATPVPAPVDQVLGPAVSSPAPARAPDRVASKPSMEPARSGERKPGEGSPRIGPPSSAPVQVAEKSTEKPGEAAPAATPKAAPRPDPDQKLTYEQRIQAAYRACKEGKPERAEVLLAGCPAESRGWEWYHCKRLCRFHPTALVGHAGPVYSIAFSPDGKRLASGGADATVRIWDQQNPAMAPLRGHTQPVTRVAFTADGTRIISASTAAMIEFDVASGKPLRTREMPIDDLTAVDISADLKWIAGGTSKGTITVWDTASGTEDFSGKTARSRPIHQVAFSQDPREIAYRTSDGWAFLQRGAANKSTGKRNQQADTKRGDSVTSVALSPDGHQLAAAAGHIVTIHDASTKRRIGEFPGRSGTVTALAFSHDGKRLASGRGDVLQLGDLLGSEWNVSFRGHAGALSEIQFSPDDRRIAASSRDGRVYVWPVADGPSNKQAGWGVAGELVEKVVKIPSLKSDIVNGFRGARSILQGAPRVSFSRDGARITLYQALLGGTARAYLLNSSSFAIYNRIDNCGTLSDNSDVAAYCDSGRILVRDVAEGAVLFETDLGGLLVGDQATSGLEIVIHPEMIVLDENRICMSFGRTNRGLATSYFGMWDRKKGGWAWKHESRDNGAKTFKDPRFSRRSGVVARVHRYRVDTFETRDTVESVSAETGDVVREFPGDDFRLHPDGDPIATLRNGEIAFWSIRGEQPLARFTKFKAVDCTFAPSGGLVAIRGNGVAAIQDLATGKIRCDFACTSPVIFDPDGRRVVSAEGGGLAIRDSSTGRVLLHLAGPTDDFAFSPDGTSIVSVNGERWQTSTRRVDLGGWTSRQTLVDVAQAKVWFADLPEVRPNAP